MGQVVGDIAPDFTDEEDEKAAVDCPGEQDLKFRSI